jgi:hypothetical protein
MAAIAPRDSRAVCSRFPPPARIAGPGPPAAAAAPLTMTGRNRRAGSHRTCKTLPARSNRDARDSRAFCSRFLCRVRLRDRAGVGGGCSLNPVAANRANRRARALQDHSRSDRIGPDAIRALYVLAFNRTSCRGNRAPKAAQSSLNASRRIRARATFLTRFSQKNRIRFARRRFVPVLFRFISPSRRRTCRP